jgi:two-component system, cell cycle sensor histidine kinase and response regulator CckA
MPGKPSYEELHQKVIDLERNIDTYRPLVENSSDLFYRTTLDGKISYISPSVYKLTGYTVEEAIGMDLAEEIYLIPDERTILLEKLQNKGEVVNFDAQLKRKDGSVWWASASAHFYRDKDGKILGVEGITRDITRLKIANQALKESEERFRLAFRTIPDAINLNRVFDGVYIDINDGFTDLTGYSRKEVIGKKSIDINIWKNLEDRKRLVDGLMKTGHVKNLEAQFVRKNGDIGIGLMSASILNINGEDVIQSITKDITERKQAEKEKEVLEKQLIQAQKLDSLGRLAGGVAHDLNNLLSPILGYSELLLDDFAINDQRKEKLEQINKAGVRARDLVHQLLAFSRKQTLEFKPVNINNVLTDFGKLLQRSIREDIEISIGQSPLMKPIMADIGQIEQVIMNLSINAADAMPEGGKLIIETALAELDETYTSTHSVVNPGEYVMLSFSDTGHGMDEGTRLKIFEPFFSTKGKQGTGLGLATVYGIVKQHKGNIWVYSELGNGTIFKVYLPITERVPADVSIKKKASLEVKGHETILLVEDDKQVRDLAHVILMENGYTVLPAQNGKDALKVCALHEDPIDLLLTDVVMPEMNGKALFSILREKQPNMKVIYMSGYTENIVSHHGVLDEGLQFIQKPFTVYNLTAKVRDALT